jgi:2,3-dihydroxy-p-cumate/2,3-dihydroxybenzoate 3,4-dioxygenase
MMISMQQVQYVRLGTADLDAAVEFATRIVGLQLVDRERRAAWFRSDERDHTLVYHTGSPDDHVVAFDVADSAALDAAAAELEALHHPVHWGGADECEQRRVKSFVRFADPTGNAIELVVRPRASGWRYFGARDAGITGFSHVGLHSTDPPRDERFWTGTGNARVSDWIGEAPLLRINPVHHSIALFPSQRSGVQHVNHQVASIDDVMRAWYFLRDQGVRIVFGPGRHPTSGAVFLYFEGPDGMVFEYSTGVKMITDEAGHRPRQFPFEPAGFCMWGSKPDIPQFRS